jgi:Cu-Zn family superoxide dismutase
MLVRQTLVASLFAAALAVAAGCQNQQAGMHHEGMNHGSATEAHHESMWASVDHAVAVIYPTKGNTVSGTLNFVKMGDGVHIRGTVTGLEPNSVHGFHIHEFGDQSSDDGAAAGGHYNPEGHPHGGPTDAQHHAGDFGNITADATGKATIDLMVNDLSIAGMKNPIIGRGVVIHGKADDLKTPPSGNAGPRIGVGVIGIAKSNNASTMPATH